MFLVQTCLIIFKKTCLMSRARYLCSSVIQTTQVVRCRLAFLPASEVFQGLTRSDQEHRPSPSSRPRLPPPPPSTISATRRMSIFGACGEVIFRLGLPSPLEGKERTVRRRGTPSVLAASSGRIRPPPGAAGWSDKIKTGRGQEGILALWS